MTVAEREKIDHTPGFEGMEADDLMSIAQASEALGVTQRTLRFYEDKGLIEPQRVSSMRVYSRREMARMQLILRGKKLGFSIREIGDFLSLYDHDPDQVAQAKLMLETTQQRLENLRQQREAIDQTISELEGIEALSQRHINMRKEKPSKRKK